MSRRRVAALLLLGALLQARPSGADTGILLLAHGGDAEWNARVLALASKVDQRQPVEVAFGMATRRTIQSAVDRLEARGVTDIVAVPLFVSSASSIITATAYLLGLRAEAPPALAIYAKMDHSNEKPSSADQSHADHADATALATTPVSSKVPITRMSAALDDHALVAAILTTRARSISRTPAEEAVILVAHGPTSDKENERWLADMRRLADRIRREEPFASIDSLTLRDDAPKPIRDGATAELRTLVSGRIAEGRRVLIVPLLLSFGGIERGLPVRLEGLAYTMAAAGLMPDDRLADWVLAMAQPSDAPAQPVRGPQ
jgi:sirohydrochlorin ferrochelatase